MHELHLEVWKMTERPPASRDFKFRDQIRDASESAQRNVSEGFGRFNPGEFAHLLDVSRASALETQALLLKARDVGYVSREEFQRLNGLAERGLQVLARFQRYLRSPRAKRNFERLRERLRREMEPTGQNDANVDGRNNPNANNPNGNDPNGNDPNGNDPNDPNANDPNDPNVPNDPNA